MAILIMKHKLVTILTTFISISILHIYIYIDDAFAKNNVEEFTLENGMRVIVVTSRKVPAISHMVWYRVGAIDEPQGKSGLAHYLEHLMFKETVKLKAGEFSKIIAKNGGNDNAFTSQDYTGYYQNISVEHIETVMDLESSRMMDLNITANSILKERDVIIEERNMRIDNRPSAILTEKMRKKLFKNHNYSIPVIGWKKEIENLEFNDVIEFYKKYYRPDNATLIVSGDIDAKTLKPLAEKYYGRLKNPSVTKEKREEHLNFIPVHYKPIEESLTDGRVQQKEWIRFYLAPSIITKKEEQKVIPFVVFSQIFGGGATSRIYQSFVVKDKIATSAGSYYNEMSYGPTAFSLFVTPADKIEFKKIESRLTEEITNIANNGVTIEELERAKNSLISESIYAKDGIRNMAYIYGQISALGLDIQYAEDWNKMIKEVSSDEIKAAAKYILDSKSYVTGKLLPKNGGNN